MANVSTTPWTWSADVLEFAREHGIDGYLDPLLEASRQVFPTATEMRAFVTRDPENREDVYIVWEIDVPKADIPNYSDLSSRWIREQFRIVPAFKIHLICPVIISVSG